MDATIQRKSAEITALEDVNKMCIESLSPDLFEKWEEVKIALIDNRALISKK